MERVKIIFIRLYQVFIDIAMFRLYLRKTKDLMKINHISNKKLAGEDEWKLRWGCLFKVDKRDYRLFYNYMVDNKLDIVPEAALHGCIERILNPFRYRDIFEDKNYFDKVFPHGSMPITIMRSILNTNEILDADYKAIKNPLELMGPFSRIIVKPTIDSGSGRGVELLIREDGKYRIQSSNELFSLQWLKTNYLKGFIMQECVEQSSYMSQFNPTSVNTFRLCVYKSILDGKAHVTAAILRIGKNGDYRDNAHAGGKYIGINSKGELNNYVCDQYGIKSNSFNGIDFSVSYFKIPNWEQIVAFATEIADCVQHQNLLALDVMLDINNMPRLIEINLKGFSSWLFLFSGQSVWGDYTDEIIDYCCEKKKELFYMNLNFFD